MPNRLWTDAKILVVDDEPANVLLLRRLLTLHGYGQVDSTSDAREVLGRFRAFNPDLVLLDLTMPHLDGITVLQQLRAELPADTFVPILVLTADVTFEAKRRALEAGASDFLTKPFEHIEVVLRIGNLLATRRLYLALEAQNHSLEDTVRERSDRLLQSEKVATMGSLLAGVAHELNNPLAILSGQSQLLRDSAQDPAVQRRAQKIADAADRCVRIVRNFLALARRRPPERADVWLSQVVAGAVELLAYELRSDDVEVAINIEERLPKLWGDPHQLHQVVVNLVGNAYQAMRGRPGPRRLSITARHDAAREVVALVVSDTGPGIPADIRAKIFEPFFTTKPVGEGTGLGLSLCRGIVEAHGGTITVESEPAQGTRFTIELPVTTKTATAGVGAPDASWRPVSPKTVLVVDDEPEVAIVIAESVERDGHKVDIARNGAIALEMLASASYDLVISDTKMPVLDGERFHAELLHRFPALRERIIFVTGDVLSQPKRDFLERTGAPFLAKPCDLRELRLLVNRLLAGALSASPR